MKKVLIVLGIGCGGLLLVLMLVIAVGGIWFAKNKDSLIAAAQNAGEEGKTFGQSTDQDGCVDEAFSREDATPGIAAEVKTGIFLRICLDNAKAVDGFCDDVPKTGSILASATWRVSRCKALGRTADSDKCGRLLEQHQKFCEGSR